MPTRLRSLVLIAPGLLVAGLLFARESSAQSPDSPSAVKVTVTPGRTWTLGPDKVTFDTNFPRARLSQCELREDGRFDLLILPENKPINHSPWFAFKVSAPQPTTITLRLSCESGSIRYIPKISTDGDRFVTLPAEAFELTADKTTDKNKQGLVRLEVGPEPIWVAAQEFTSRDELESWSRTLERLPFVTRAEIGRSIGDRPIYKLDIGDGGAKPAHVVIIGRQHPPEVTGSLALMRFIEEIAGDSELSRSFRGEFHVLLVPLVNPDGVDLGHWRHNLGGVDLNRDWGTFAQPETRAVRDEALKLSKQGKLYLHLDFHSTFHDVFYTQKDDRPGGPDYFTAPWLAALQSRVPDYRVNRSPSEPTRLTTSTSWAYRTFDIPAITYEIGDNTDRAELRQISAAAAQEMMKLLLAEKKKAGNQP